MQTATRSLFSLKTAGWRETLVLMAVSWLVPVLVHLVPWDGPRPLGVYLLPAFWTAFVAVYFYGAGVGLLVALVTPVANLLLTGLPMLGMMGMLSLELAGFVAASAWLLRRWPAFRFAAPLAWLPARALAIAVQWAVPAFGDHRNPFAHLRDSTTGSLAGLIVLLVINIALVRLAPRERD
jgi:hypothetical protein